MPDLKISQLAAGTTPLAGTELVPIVQSGVTSRTTVGAIMTSTVPSGTANGVLYLNASKVATSGAGLVFDSSGNLGIGTVLPGNRLHVQGSGDVARFTNGSQNAYIALDSAGYSLLTGAGQTGNGIYANATSNLVQLFTNSTARTTLDASGNLGLGVTPSAWLNTTKALTVLGATLSRDDSVNARLTLSNNAFRNSSGVWTYISNGGAANYEQVFSGGGAHQWYNAISGTAGAAISFTQAMTLDASGNLLVGQTSDGLTEANRTVFALNGATNSLIALRYGGTLGGFLWANGSTAFNLAANNLPITFSNGSAGNTERARITAAGNQTAFQPAESAQNTSVTLTVANLQTRIITSNAAVTLTLPTGTDLEGYTASMATNSAFECTFIATTANAITIAANANTTVGNLTVSGNTSGTFRFRKTATNTFTVYRVA